MKREKEFDIAKGVTITAIVMIHNNADIPLIGQFFQPYCIAIFFVIAGYFHKKNEIIKTRICNLIQGGGEL